ncbi:ABC-type nitrate/sulfonate/bicarbonate transport systems periplasmic components-like protein [Ammonifex degensii KC4]|uniref:ABC-type nitrate/sulfonate/bicarbonate transport systems periplasmic components-like protein n=1 Tax=Ammonifex degensii (strain DSM 10501 / KC4) TaxID=429009 RepID=C9RBL7_AMMDK|nr:ABC transporter substrate-binding protein [Ammonifex degensii]ACX51644.1 ABC-type nitrate/sulfonate/bicarbonate transport systems periplasmic components-like protein [Ammonifex degensii KC4]
MRRLLFLGITIILLGLALAFWYREGKRISSTPGTQELTVLLPSPRVEFLPLYWAAASGEAEKEGLVLKLLPSASPSPGEKTLAALTAEEALCGRTLEGKKWKVVALLSEKELAWLAGRQPFRWEDLPGKKVITPAAEQGLTAAFEEVLREQGWRPHRDLILITNLPPHLRLPAFAAGVGDLLLTPDPLILSGRFRFSSLPLSLPPFPRWVLVAEEGRVPEKAVLALGRALEASQAKLYSLPPQEIAGETAVFFPQLSLEVLTRAIDRAQRERIWKAGELPHPQAFARLQEILKRAGELPRPLDYQELFFTPAPRPLREEGNRAGGSASAAPRR